MDKEVDVTVTSEEVKEEEVVPEEVAEIAPISDGMVEDAETSVSKKKKSRKSDDELVKESEEVVVPQIDKSKNPYHVGDLVRLKPTVTRYANNTQIPPYCKSATMKIIEIVDNKFVKVFHGFSSGIISIDNIK